MTAPPRPPRLSKTRTALLTLYAHGFELAVAVMLAITSVSNGLDPAALATILTPGMVGVWVTLNTVGIIAMTVGLFGSADVTGATPRRTSAMRATEKAGLYLLAATEAALGIAVAVALPPDQAWSPCAQLAAIGAACLLRAGAIRKAERIQLEALERLSASDYLNRHVLGRDEEGEPDGE